MKSWLWQLPLGAALTTGIVWVGAHANAPARTMTGAGWILIALLGGLLLATFGSYERELNGYRDRLANLELYVAGWDQAEVAALEPFLDEPHEQAPRLATMPLTVVSVQTAEADPAVVPAPETVPIPIVQPEQPATVPTTQAIDSWQVELDRQYQEARAAIDAIGGSK